MEDHSNITKDSILTEVISYIKKLKSELDELNKSYVPVMDPYDEIRGVTQNELNLGFKMVYKKESTKLFHIESHRSNLIKIF